MSGAEVLLAGGARPVPALGAAQDGDMREARFARGLSEA
jgi:hypothetical protein